MGLKKHNPGCNCCGDCIACDLTYDSVLFEVDSDCCNVSHSTNYGDPMNFRDHCTETGSCFLGVKETSTTLSETITTGTHSTHTCDVSIIDISSTPCSSNYSPCTSSWPCSSTSRESPPIWYPSSLIIKHKFSVYCPTFVEYETTRDSVIVRVYVVPIMLYTRAHCFTGNYLQRTTTYDCYYYDPDEQYYRTSQIYWSWESANTCTISTVEHATRSLIDELAEAGITTDESTLDACGCLESIYITTSSCAGDWNLDDGGWGGLNVPQCIGLAYENLGYILVRQKEQAVDWCEVQNTEITITLSGADDVDHGLGSAEIIQDDDGQFITGIYYRQAVCNPTTTDLWTAAGTTCPAPDASSKCVYYNKYTFQSGLTTGTELAYTWCNVTEVRLTLVAP